MIELGTEDWAYEIISSSSSSASSRGGCRGRSSSRWTRGCSATGDPTAAACNLHCPYDIVEVDATEIVMGVNSI